MTQCPACGSRLVDHTFGETYCSPCHKWWTEEKIANVRRTAIV